MYIEIDSKNLKKIENPKMQAAKKKKKRKVKNITKIMIFAFIAIGVFSFALISPVFNITNIEINGNEKIADETILSLSKVQENTNIFKISKEKIKKYVTENPYIESVDIKRKLPGTLQINVKERELQYQIKVIDSYVYIDYQGYILEVSSKKADVPLVEGFETEQNDLLNGKRVTNADIEKLMSMLKIMHAAKSADIAHEITKIKIKDGEYILELKDNKTAYLGSGEEWTNKIMFLKTILKEETGNKGIIFLNGDLNNGFKPYFREE